MYIHTYIIHNISLSLSVSLSLCSTRCLWSHSAGSSETEAWYLCTALRCLLGTVVVA